MNHLGRDSHNRTEYFVASLLEDLFGLVFQGSQSASAAFMAAEE